MVVAAGSSARFGHPVPKQFHELAGRSVLERSVEALACCSAVRGVVVVLAAGELGGPHALNLRRRADVLDVLAGGATRAESVLAGLRAAGDAPFVLVHDAARPLVCRELVDAVVEATRRRGAALPGLEVPDTVKQLDDAGTVSRTLDRSRLRLAQTPQGSRTSWLLEALSGATMEAEQVTDEAAALERVGRPVEVVPGDPGNFKITSPDDLARARRIVEAEMHGLRIGSGFDVHRVDASRRLFLGGVEFEDEPGLSGHSDADVVLHAAMDAVLGAAGLGDIGAWFPPGDPQFAGAASTGLTERVAAMLAREGYALVNLDLTLLAERPKIRDRVDEMRTTIARALGVDRSRIGLKATTLEQLGALGRHEGIACQAVALIRRTQAAG